MNAFKDAAKKRKAQPGGALKKQEKDKATNESKAKIIDSDSKGYEKAPQSKKSEEIDALLDEITGDKKPLKKSATLYLSQDNLSELKKRAKKAGISSSEFMDKLMTKLFSTNK